MYLFNQAETHVIACPPQILSELQSTDLVKIKILIHKPFLRNRFDLEFKDSMK